MLIKCEPSSLYKQVENYYDVVRGYVCDECNETFGEIVKAASPVRKRCPDCNKNSLESLILGVPTCFVQQDAVTLGQQAERNMKKWGKDETAERQHKHEEQGRKGRKKLGTASPFGEAPKDLDTYTPAEQKAYIIDGKTK